MLNIVKKYLVLNRYYDQKNLFEATFLSHPNYPSLYSVTDSLSYLSIENIAIKIPKEQFAELPELFLSVFIEELVLIKKTDSIVLIENEKGKKLKLSTDKFLKDWSQIILVIEPSTKATGIQIKKSYSKWLLYLLPVILLVTLSVFFLDFSLFSISILGLTLIGLVFSVLILQEKFGIKTQLGSKICNVNRKTSCYSVIQSDKSEIFKGLSFSDLPIVFFGINFLSILLEPIYSSLIVSALSFFSMPFLLYSIWIQRVVIQKWCLLCLVVSIIIFLEGLFYILQFTSFKNLTFLGSFTYIQSSILIIISWYLVKPIIESSIILKNELNGYKRFKRNFKVFKSFTKKIEVEEGFEKLRGIQYGNPNAVINLTLFLSPTCAHCHKAFDDAKNLFEANQDKVSLNVLFNVNTANRDNQYLTIVETLLTINSLNEELAKEALSDWHIKKMNLIDWQVKWQVSSFDIIANNQLMWQYEWCFANKFNFTPVKIVNGKVFPNEYEINELKYFINDFSHSNEAKFEDKLQKV